MSARTRLYLHRIHRLDSNLCVAVNHTSRYKFIRHAFRVVSRLGDGVFWYVLMLGVLVAYGVDGIPAVLHMAVAGLVGTLIYKWLKGKTLRPRPYQVRQEIRLEGTPLDKFSFPSGHTLHAVLFSMLATHYYPQLAVILVIFSTMVAISRVVLGLHYPSDVLAGAIIGALIAMGSLLCV
ncbi:MAG: phosphatase PAP2 family protein [Betaproteobacteria bacterium HGW-Betaproteobacteria-22]|nr:MAG: phosphatase PAP2 family protein [Betaproteobacteria bacterium HGW-Betaproteobacteria-22]